MDNVKHVTESEYLATVDAANLRVWAYEYKTNGRVFFNDSIYFVKKTNLLAETLFNTKGAALGYYKILKGRIHFFKPNGNIFAAFIMNKYNENFLVSATLCDGNVFYMSALSTVTEKELGLNDWKTKKQLDLRLVTYFKGAQK